MNQKADIRGDDNVVVGRDNRGNIVQVNLGAQPIGALYVRAPVPDFKGREREIAELSARLRGGDSVGICGINGLGGIGKTELALVIADKLRDAYALQLFVQLRGASEDPLTAEAALAECIRPFVGLEARLPDDLSSLAHLYQQSLGGRRVLVILDDAADARQIEALRPPRGSALLVTSRETIALPGMHRTKLEELPPPEARALLLEAAPHVEAGTADRICLLCGCLPLAIRAAAGTLAEYDDLDPAQFAEELAGERRRLELLDPGRNLSVEASFGLSYKRLPPDEARVFRRLAVFAPAALFGARAVETVCGDPSHAALSELTRRNLVIFDKQERRYRLHDLARVFAGARIDADERDAAERGHARYYQTLLDEVDALYLQGGEAMVRGLALFDRDWTNIRAGHAWAAARLDSDDEAARLCMDYPNSGVYALALRQHPRARIEWLELHLAAARTLKRRDDEEIALGNLGTAYADLGATGKATEHHEEALVISREIGDRRGEGNALGSLGMIYADLGETRKAIEHYEGHLKIAREIGDRRGEGSMLGNLGVGYADLGETGKAIEHHEQALLVLQEIGDRRGEGSTLGNLGLAYAALGETRKAIEHYEQHIAIAREIGHQAGEANSLYSLGRELAKQGQTPEAIEHFEAALAIFEQIESPRAAWARERLMELKGNSGSQVVD